MKRLFAICAVAILSAAGTANAQPPITFSEFPVGTFISNQYAPRGVVFLPGTITGQLPQIAWNSPNLLGQPDLRPTGESTPPEFYAYMGDFWMQFPVPALEVTFDSGWWDGHSTGIIDVYDPDMNLLDSRTNATWNGMESMSISGLGEIGRIYFNSMNDVCGADIDNLSFTLVPVPGAILLAMLGLGAAGLKLRKFA